MNKHVEFYLDFASPFAYFASFKIDEMAEKYGYTCEWIPMFLGAAFQKSGGKPFTEVPMKHEYSIMDTERTARFMEVPYQIPDVFPILSINPSRAFYWLQERDGNQVKAKKFAKAVFHAYFAENKNIMAPEVLAEVAKSIGEDPEEMGAGMQSAEIKEKFKVVNDSAIEKGVFGSPFFIVDGEAFWGSDRLWMIKRWMRSGGW
ncbi:MAG: 2-hydroxychromene-2-carboxylate isomerase [Rhodospirillales bacterium]|nr:2-hydroxychromene-2-carboxylate isomerase [Rhodospirillales bacterium]